MRRFFTILCILIVEACTPPRHVEKDPAIKEGIEGFVKEIKGNQMPSPSRKLPSPAGLSAPVYVYEITNVSQTERIGNSAFYKDIHTKLIQSAESDSMGHFAISLPPGDYSLFTKVDGKYYSNNFDSLNNISPAKVEKNKVTQVNIIVSAHATF